MNHDDSTTYRGSLPKNAAALRIWHDTGPGEAALEPALPIVDPHHHLFGKATDAQYYRRFDLERDLAGGHRIVGTVYVEAYASGWRTSGPEREWPKSGAPSMTQELHSKILRFACQAGTNA